MGALGSIAGRKRLKTSPTADSLPVVAPPRLLEVRVAGAVALAAVLFSDRATTPRKSISDWFSCSNPTTRLKARFEVVQEL